MVFKRHVEGDISKAEDCKVAVYSCPLDIMQTETKVTSTDPHHITLPVSSLHVARIII